MVNGTTLANCNLRANSHKKVSHLLIDCATKTMKLFFPILMFFLVSFLSGSWLVGLLVMIVIALLLK